MTTPGGFDPRNDPTAPSYEPPTYDTPTYDTPTYGPPTYGPPTSGGPSLDKSPAEDPSAAWPPPEPAESQGSGWYLAPPSGSGLPPGPDQPYQPGPAQPVSPQGPTYPGYAPGPAGTSKSGRGPVVALVIGVVAVLALAAVGLGFLLTSGDDDRRTAAPPPPTSRSASPTTSSPTSSASPTGSASSSAPSDDADEVKVPAVTPGFQGVLSPQENVAYDVPEGWEVQTPGTLVGYKDADGNPVALIHGVSTYLPDACPDVSGSNRGNAGFKTAGTVDPAQAVQDGVTLFAQAAALNDDGSTAPVTPGTLTDVAVAGGAITAKMFTATVTPAAGADCGAPSIAFTGVAFATPGGGTALFIMFLDQGTSDALPAATAQQIVASLRPYTG